MTTIDSSELASDPPMTKHCDVCDLDVPLSEWTIDEYRCDYCCWDAKEMEAYGDYLVDSVAG